VWPDDEIGRLIRVTPETRVAVLCGLAPDAGEVFDLSVGLFMNQSGSSTWEARSATSA
jgi:hypothetical protein